MNPYKIAQASELSRPFQPAHSAKSHRMYIGSSQVRSGCAPDMQTMSGSPLHHGDDTRQYPTGSASAVANYHQLYSFVTQAEHFNAEHDFGLTSHCSSIPFAVSGECQTRLQRLFGRSTSCTATSATVLRTKRGCQWLCSFECSDGRSLGRPAARS